MKKSSTISAITLVAAAAVAFAGSAQAETHHAGDPARWYVADTTPQMRYATSVKEANAAYQEALHECRHTVGSNSRCLRAAEHEHNAALGNARMALHAQEGHSHRDVAGR